MDDYVFYSERADGLALALEVWPCRTDTDAMGKAEDVLFNHASAEKVAIWCGERFVGRTARSDLVANGIA